MMKRKSDDSTQKGNFLTVKYLSPVCNPLTSTTLAEQTTWRLQTLKLAGSKPLYLLVFFLKELCETEMLSSSRAEGKDTCSFLGIYCFFSPSYNLNFWWACFHESLSSCRMECYDFPFQKAEMSSSRLTPPFLALFGQVENLGVYFPQNFGGRTLYSCHFKTH